MNNQRKKIWVVGWVVLAALVAWLAWLLLRPQPQPSTTTAATSTTTTQTATTSTATVQPSITTLKIVTGGQADQVAYDGVVESVRQSAIAAQVAGNVVDIRVRAGDRVAAGQLLLRIDGQAAEQAAMAARNEYQRQLALYRKNYISKAALEQAQVQLAAANAQSGYFYIKAPFSGVVSEVNAKLGEMAMPGMPLLQLFDPNAMRISAQVPQSQLVKIPKSVQARVELAGMSSAEQWLAPASVEVLPSVDARTHSGTIRLPLKATNIDLTPGAFARVWLTLPQALNETTETTGSTQAAIWIPSSAVLRRGEVNAVYVKSSEGQFLMRQVRLGAIQGERVQVLTGLSPDDEIAADPQMAAGLNTTAK